VPPFLMPLCQQTRLNLVVATLFSCNFEDYGSK
jgi:hypothetical protein